MALQQMHKWNTIPPNSHFCAIGQIWERANGISWLEMNEAGVVLWQVQTFSGSDLVQQPSKVLWRIFAGNDLSHLEPDLFVLTKSDPVPCEFAWSIFVHKDLPIKRMAQQRTGHLRQPWKHVKTRWPTLATKEMSCAMRCECMHDVRGNAASQRGANPKSPFPGWWITIQYTCTFLKYVL